MKGERGCVRHQCRIEFFGINSKHFLFAIGEKADRKGLSQLTENQLAKSRAAEPKFWQLQPLHSASFIRNLPFHPKVQNNGAPKFSIKQIILIPTREAL
jgi:hypothetical protein